MIGVKLYKNQKSDMAKYSDIAVWCNANNNAHIVDQGDYYEVVANVTPEPTTAEQIAALDAQYEKDKDELRSYYVDAQMAGDNAGMQSVVDELAMVTAQYDADIEALN